MPKQSKERSLKSFSLEGSSVRTFILAVGGSVFSAFEMVVSTVNRVGRLLPNYPHVYIPSEGYIFK